MSLPLTDKVALVTGSGQGIGAAIAKRLATDGAFVVVHYLTSVDAARKVADEINTEGRGKAITIQADLSTVAEGSRLVEEVVQRCGKLDILVLNAAYIDGQPLERVVEVEFDKHFTVNVKVPLFQVQTAAKHMAHGTSPRCNTGRPWLMGLSGGRVIWISSSVTKNSSVGPQTVLYNITKGSVEQLVRVLAKDLGAKGITVNAVAPAATETELYTKTWSKEFTERFASLHPMKRIGRPDDMAPIVTFLASDGAGWINGQAIHVNNVSLYTASCEMSTLSIPCRQGYVV